MQIPLNAFELHVAPSALDKGLKLFENGKVDTIVNVGNGRLEGVVHDENTVWHPALVLRNEQIVEAQCECTKGEDRLCHHLVAAVFAIEAGSFGEELKRPKAKKESLDFDKKPAKAKAAKKPPKPKAPKPIRNVAGILERVPKEEIVAFLLQAAKIDKSLDARIKAHFNDLLPATTPAEIEKRITEVYKASLNAKKTITAASFKVLAQRLMTWAEEAERFVVVKDYVLAIATLKAMSSCLFEIPASIQDPEGLLHKIWSYCIKIADQFQSLKIEPSDEAAISEFILGTKKGKSTIVELELLPILYCKKAADLDQFELFVRYNSTSEKLTKTYYEALIRLKGKGEAEQYREKHKDFQYFLQLDVAAAKANKDHKKAIAIMLRGMRGYGTQSTFWAKQLDNFYEEIGDQKGRLDFARSLYKSSTNSLDTFAHNVMKIGGMELWKQEREAILNALSPRPGDWKTQMVAEEAFSFFEDTEGFVQYLSKLPHNNLLKWRERVGDFENECLREVVSNWVENEILKKPNNKSIQPMVRKLVIHCGREEAKQFLLELADKCGNNLLSKETAKYYAQEAGKLNYYYY